MKILQDFYRRLRSGEASEEELVTMDRRAFLFGMTATAAGLVAAPKVFLPKERGLSLVRESWERDHERMAWVGTRRTGPVGLVVETTFYDEAVDDAHYKEVIRAAKHLRRTMSKDIPF